MSGTCHKPWIYWFLFWGAVQKMKTEVVSFYRCERSGGINKTGLCPQFRIAIFLSICLGFRVFEYIFNSTLCTTCGEHIVHIDGVVGSSPTVTTTNLAGQRLQGFSYVQNQQRLICRREKSYLQNTNINEILRTPPRVRKSSKNWAPLRATRSHRFFRNNVFFNFNAFLFSIFYGVPRTARCSIVIGNLLDKGYRHMVFLMGDKETDKISTARRNGMLQMFEEEELTFTTLYGDSTYESGLHLLNKHYLQLNARIFFYAQTIIWQWRVYRCSGIKGSVHQKI